MQRPYYDEAIKWLDAHELPEPHHKLRFAETYDLIRRKMVCKHILECGGSSIFTQLLADLVPGETLRNTPGELRNLGVSPPGPAPDTILMMEVIEHIHDLPIDVHRHMWTGSGQQRVIENALSWLSPCSLSYLLVTTPNPISLVPMWRAYKGYPCRHYDPHVRELTQEELWDIIKAAGGRVVEAGGWNVWGMDQEERFRACLTFPPKIQNRPDCHWALVEKVK